MAEDPPQLGESPTGSGYDILGLGMSMVDTIQRIEDFPSSTGVTEVSDSVLMGGGPVPTALCAASRLGARTAIVDRVGSDWRGHLIRDDYEKYGVDTRFLTQQPDRSSSFGIVLVRERDGERHIVFQRGTFDELRPEELPDAELRRCRFLHLNGRHWPAALEAARIVRKCGGIVSFDGGAHRYDSRIEPLLEETDLIIVARDFARCLAGSEDHEAQLRQLQRRGGQLVGITDGVRGSWFLSSTGESFHQQAYAVDKMVDTTGCGDVFHGAFLFARSRGDSWRNCARFASAAAAINATGLGGRGHLATEPEVESFLATCETISREPV